MSAANYVIYGCSSSRTSPEATSYHYTEASHCLKNIVAVISQDRVKYTWHPPSKHNTQLFEKLFFSIDHNCIKNLDPHLIKYFWFLKAICLSLYDHLQTLFIIVINLKEFKPKSFKRAQI